MKLILKNFYLIDEETDMFGKVVIEDGIIEAVLPGERSSLSRVDEDGAVMVIDGQCLMSNGLPVLMPAFVDLHAHFREPAFPSELSSPSEVLESASLAAAAGGYGTVISMANTRPPIDTIEKVTALKDRSDMLRLIDLYPVMSLTKGMEGKELSEITALPPRPAVWDEQSWKGPLMLSEDGKDLGDDDLFLLVMKEARRIGVPISCHCDFGGSGADKTAGQTRSVLSRMEENNAVRRVIELGKKAGCHIHIAHVSTKEAAELIRRTKAELAAELSVKESAGNNAARGFALSCEAMPHNLMLTEEDAKLLGEESFGRVNPPLRSEEDRKALVEAIRDGTIDSLATDHAPHSLSAKEKGAPGFSGLETAFAVFNSVLVQAEGFSLSCLSGLMSANPARLIGLGGPGPGARGRLLPGYRADLVIADTDAPWIVNPAELKTRGKNTPFAGRRLYGKITMTIHRGRVVFEL